MRQPEQLTPDKVALNQFVNTSNQYVAERRRFLQRELGAGIGLVGAMVIGAVAMGTETPNDNLDLVTFARENGGDDDHYVDHLNRTLDVRFVDHQYNVTVQDDDEFPPQDWGTMVDQSALDRGFYFLNFNTLGMDDIAA